MAGNALEESEGVADAVGLRGAELGWVEEVVNGDDLLEEDGYDTEGVPEHGREVWVGVTLLAKVEQGSLALALVLKREHQLLRHAFTALALLRHLRRLLRLHYELFLYRPFLP